MKLSYWVDQRQYKFFIADSVREIFAVFVIKVDIIIHNTLYI